MAVVVTAKSGYDLGYVWRGLQGQPERTAGGYYLNASLQGEARPLVRPRRRGSGANGRSVPRAVHGGLRAAAPGDR